MIEGKTVQITIQTNDLLTGVKAIIDTPELVKKEVELLPVVEAGGEGY
ncbi:hypothetical protein L1765_03720 [Microaerobacter geothermalis]|nr:hypothetical protein [Microaerobacter geothermalis]MCF6093102.1 hypothetical protein [Microaerobacter geothermalis]